MIDALISSKTRIKLLMKFFLNSKTRAYLRGLATEFNESTNAIRVELNRMEQAGMLNCHNEGNRRYFAVNTEYPLYQEIRSILMKHIGIDRIIRNVVENLGEIEQVFLLGSFAKGTDGPVVDLLMVGNIDRQYLAQLVQKAESRIDRKIRTLVYSAEEFEKLDMSKFTVEPLLLWNHLQDNVQDVSGN